MNKQRFRAITKRRLQVNQVDRHYLDEGAEVHWVNAMIFEFQNYGSRQNNRLYLFKRWQKRIDNLPLANNFRWDLYTYLVEAAVIKLRAHEKWVKATSSKD